LLGVSLSLVLDNALVLAFVFGNKGVARNDEAGRTGRFLAYADAGRA
jgi:hypothetical protein